MVFYSALISIFRQLWDQNFVERWIYFVHRLSVSCGKLLRLICTNLKFRGLRLMEIMTKFRITVQEPGVCVFVCRCVRSCIGQSARSSGAPCMSDLSPASCRRVTLGWHWPHTGKTLLPAHPQTGHIYLAFIALHALLHTLSSTDTHTLKGKSGFFIFSSNWPWNKNVIFMISYILAVDSETSLLTHTDPHHTSLLWDLLYAFMNSSQGCNITC